MIEQLEKPIRKAARSVAFKWPGVVEADDVEQDIITRLLESPGSLETILGMDERPQYKALVGMGHQIAGKERASHEYFSGNFRYCVEEVRDVLESGVLKDLKDLEIPIDSSWDTTDYTSGSEFEDRLTHRLSVEMDLKRGLKDLAVRNGRHYELIHRRYVRDETLEVGRDRDTCNRAVHSLTVLMNRSFKRQNADRLDGPGTRRPVRSREWV